MGHTPASRTHALIVLLFFLSGACTLIYQVVWVRMLVLIFGTNVLAVSTVLTAFMAGLALGSAWFGRLVDGKVDALRVYAWLELVIGLFALGFPIMFVSLDSAYTSIYRLLHGSGNVLLLIRFLISFLILLPPTTLMGATLPVLSKFVARRLSGVGWSVGALYALNTFGAAAGCLAAAFFLMGHLGIQGTIRVAAAGNLLIAGLCFFLIDRQKGSRRKPASTTVTETGDAPAVTVLAPVDTRLVFWGYALSGFTALGYEVVWTRILSITLRITTTQSLSTILITFLFGLAAGGIVGARFADRWKQPLAAFGVLELALGLSGLASIAVIGAVPGLLAALGPYYSWWGSLLRLFLVGFAVTLPPTFIMGLLFPVAGKLNVSGLQRLGRGIGNIYAANTTGSIFGAFAAGFVLIPLIGSQMSLLLLAWINIAVGAVVVLRARQVRRGMRWAAIGAVTAVAATVTLLLPPTLVVGLFETALPRSALLYHDEGAGGTVTVHELDNRQLMLRVNGAGEVPTDHRSIQIFRLLGNLPLLLHPDSQEVLVIAFGGGITLASVELHAPRRIECVEVVQGVFGAARYFARYNNRVFDRFDADNMHVIVDDGRNHVRRTDRQYDVIISDSTHPGTADSWILYTREFYRICQRRLKDGGIVAQWLPLHGLSVEDYQTILRTFREVFPHASLWLTGGYTVLLGTPERLQIDVQLLTRRLEDEAIRRNLAEVDLGDPVSLLATLLLDEDAMAGYVGPGPTNTDDHPRLGFSDRGRAGTQRGLPVLISLLPFLDERVAPDLLRGDREVLQRLERRLRARKHAFLGDIALQVGDRQRAVQQLRRARAVDPEEHDARRMLRRLTRVAPLPEGP